MTKVMLILAALSLSSCVAYRPAPVEFVTEERLASREARAQCRALARNLVQMARCDGR